MQKGRITIPTDASFVEETKKIIARWGADAVRDCDGTVLPKNAKELADKVYNTYFVIRGDNEWAKNNLDELEHVFLMSNFFTATEKTLTMHIMDGYFEQQLKADFGTTSYWEVMDRTDNQLVESFSYSEKDGTVTIDNAKPFHEYTVSFMAWSIWDPVQMYNYITNNWDVEKQMMYDPKYPKTAEYVERHMREWCLAHGETNVVRFTTFLYQFSLVFNDKKKERYVDWFGYTMSVSPLMLDEFEKEYGYKMRAEYIIDNGYYNNTFRVPSKQYLDYMDFVQRYVTKKAGKLVEIVHENGKEAMMFLGDCWIGAEPYGKYFKDINLDAVVGSVGGGVTVRMLSEIPHVKVREGRFLPYFFPDTFYEGNDPTIELNHNWLTARRAIMRKPLDRIGYGGYLSLAAKFPKFIDRVEEICNEFRTIHSAVEGGKAYSGVKVAILNAWGKIRSWMSHMVAHELWYQQIYSYQGILEALSGLAVDVDFIDFDDVKNGKLNDYDVVINAGDAYTAFSGGSKWDEEVVSKVREYVYNGGGFIGVGEPSAYEKGGRFFRLADVLGVDKEVGFTLSLDKYNINKETSHFITKDLTSPVDYGEGMKNIYALDGAKVLDITFSDRFQRKVNVGEVKMACNQYGKGRAFYIAGIPYNFDNARLLYRAIYWTAGKDAEINKAFSTNPLTECNYYPNKSTYAVVNNSNDTQTTDFYDISGEKTTLTLAPMEIKWIKK